VASRGTDKFGTYLIRRLQDADIDGKRNDKLKKNKARQGREDEKRSRNPGTIKDH